jgi:hypothetical protein
MHPQCPWIRKNQNPPKKCPTVNPHWPPPLANTRKGNPQTRPRFLALGKSLVLGDKLCMEFCCDLDEDLPKVCMCGKCHSRRHVGRNRAGCSTTIDRFEEGVPYSKSHMACVA